MGPSARELVSRAFDWSYWTITQFPDSVDCFNRLCGYYDGTQSLSSKSKVLDPRQTFFKKYNQIIRLPLILSGFGMIGKYGLEFIEGNLNAESNYFLMYGLGNISLASSMYLKDKDPKLLEKQPMWKDAFNLIRNGYENVADKIGGIIPQPEPQLIPLESKFSLENIIK